MKANRIITTVVLIVFVAVLGGCQSVPKKSPCVDGGFMVAGAAAAAESGPCVTEPFGLQVHRR